MKSTEHLSKIRVKKVKYFFRQTALPAVIFVLLGALTLAFFKSNYLKVESYEVLGVQTFQGKDDIESVVSQNVLGRNIVLLNSGSLRNTLKDTFQYFSDVKIEKKLPGTVTVRMIERTPLAVLSDSGAEVYYMVDKEGYVLGEVDPGSTRLPKIAYRGSVSIKTGTFIPEDLINTYLNVFAALDAQNLTFSEVVADGGFVEIRLSNGSVAYISIKRDVAKSISVLKQIVLKYSLENKILKKVDLRYDNVVVE